MRVKEGGRSAGQEGVHLGHHRSGGLGERERLGVEFMI